MSSQIKAHKIRINILKMINKGESSHIGSALSCVDLLTCIYSSFLNFDSKNPLSSKRDFFILSKGHAGAAIYATLSEFNFFPEEKLYTHYQNGSDLSGHVSHKNIPGVEFSTGSLGHGLSVGAGIALGFKKKGLDQKACVLLSDGECDEGSVWEAAMFSSHHNLNNLIAVIDYNKIQSLEEVSKTLSLEPFSKKWESFGWNVIEIDGHNHDEIKSALKQSQKLKSPCCIIAHTIKGKGISFMENSVLWHYRSPQGKEFKEALRELETKDIT